MGMHDRQLTAIAQEAALLEFDCDIDTGDGASDTVYLHKRSDPGAYGLFVICDKGLEFALDYLKRYRVFLEQVDAYRAQQSERCPRRRRWWQCRGAFIKW